MARSLSLITTLSHDLLIYLLSHPEPPHAALLVRGGQEDASLPQLEAGPAQVVLPGVEDVARLPQIILVPFPYRPRDLDDRPRPAKTLESLDDPIG